MSPAATPVALDTSAAVPYLLASHPGHSAVRSAVGDRSPILTSHSLAETYAVVTRLPRDARVSPGDASRLIDSNFAAPALMDSRLVSAVHRELSRHGVSGGATYDGLVALAAVQNNLILLTRDARALATYARLGVRTEVLD